jgi:hypothetical protein
MALYLEIFFSCATDTNKTRVVKRTVPAETFFTFFSPPAVPADGDVIDEDEAEGLDEKLEQDYDLGMSPRTLSLVCNW